MTFLKVTITFYAKIRIFRVVNYKNKYYRHEYRKIM